MSTSPSMQDLFATARNDAPSGAVQELVWGRVAAVTSVPAGAAVATKGTAVFLGTKMVSLIAVVAAAGAAVTALSITTPEAPPAKQANARRTPVASSHAEGARLADPAPRGRSPKVVTQKAEVPPAAIPAAMAETVAVVASPPDDASSLAEEARLVTEARAALLRGDPTRALALARRTRQLPARALEPEELGLEARALRALNRPDEALASELTLRSRFPSHALSR